MPSYPIYLLELGKETRVVFPESREEIGHTDFWEQTASFVLAEPFKLPQKKLVNLPYCQRRGRIVGSKLYYGEKDGPEVLLLVKQAVGDGELILCFGDHEKRLKEDVRRFKDLLIRQGI